MQDAFTPPRAAFVLRVLAASAVAGSLFCAAAMAACHAGSASDDAATLRDPMMQPFASTSIWNMPIGTGAVYVEAHIAPPTKNALKGDEDIIVLTPAASTTPIYKSTAGWNTNISRCPYDAGTLLFDAPLPTSFVYGDTPVNSAPNGKLGSHELPRVPATSVRSRGRPQRTSLLARALSDAAL